MSFFKKVYSLLSVRVGGESCKQGGKEGLTKLKSNLKHRVLHHEKHRDLIHYILVAKQQTTKSTESHLPTGGFLWNQCNCGLTL